MRLWPLAALIAVAFADDGSTTTTPEARTGKISQFKGFNTPKPFPPNANFMYASVWAGWSAWSFCAGNVQVRVRACNTVRGYSCPGSNRETKPCDSRQRNAERAENKRPGTDYDVVDPWEADRKEALKQLYTDYHNEDKAPGIKPPRVNPEFRKQLSAGRTLEVNEQKGPKEPPRSGIGRPESPKPAQAPSMTPEQLYERRKPEKEPKLRSKSKNEGIAESPILHEGSATTLRPPMPPKPSPTSTQISTTTTKPSAVLSGTVGEGDHVHLSSSLQQHFANEKFVGKGSVKEEPLASALDTPTVPPTTTTVTTPKPSARKPTNAETEELARKLQKAIKSPHSGEVEPIHLDDDTTRALEWMLQNMSRAAEVAAKLNKTQQMPNINLDVSLKSGENIPQTAPNNNLRRKVLASKTFPIDGEHREPSNLHGNPNEEEEIQTELSRLRENMKQMEDELKELREAEAVAERPKFSGKAMNLDLVPKGPSSTFAPPPQPQSSETFLLEEPKRKIGKLLGIKADFSAAYWSDWSPWGECFCGKQVRTRTCIYENAAHSQGCEGRSYESIQCEGGRICPKQQNLSIRRRFNELRSPSTQHFQPEPIRFYTIEPSSAERSSELFQNKRPIRG